MDFRVIFSGTVAGLTGNAKFRNLGIVSFLWIVPWLASDNMALHASSIPRPRVHAQALMGNHKDRHVRNPSFFGSDPDERDIAKCPSLVCFAPEGLLVMGSGRKNDLVGTAGQRIRAGRSIARDFHEVLVSFLEEPELLARTANHFVIKVGNDRIRFWHLRHRSVMR